MATGLRKDNIQINFAKGLSTKVDRKQVSPGNFLALENSVFDTEGLLKKRNGFLDLAPLTDVTGTTVTTHNSNLVGLGGQLSVYSADTNQWLNRGNIQSLDLDVTPVIRTAMSQSKIDAAIASNGLACITYLENALPYYQIVDSATGQAIVTAQALVAAAVFPRVFALERYFIISYLESVAGTIHLRYVAIPTSNPSAPLAPADISNHAAPIVASYDGLVSNNSVYFAYHATDIGNALRLTFLDSSLIVHTEAVLAGAFSTIISLTADNSTSTPTIWLSWYDSAVVRTAAFSSTLVNILGNTACETIANVIALTSTATGNIVRQYYEVSQNYSYVSVRSDYLKTNAINIDGIVAGASIMARNLGLASKAVYLTDTNLAYMLAVQDSAYQPTYFLIDEMGNILGKLAYSNSGGYVTNQVLPNATLDGTQITVPYLLKTSLTPVNKAQGASAVGGIYSTLGVNLARFNINNNELVTSEIAGSLNVCGGILWQYDGVKPVEQGFNLWPENIKATGSGSGGTITAGTYYYAVTYEWTDAQGLLHRSAPSIATPSVTTTGSSSSVALDIPTLRQTYKTSPNPVRIVIYRYSILQPIYYQVTSITSTSGTNPMVLNNPAADSVTFTDALPDSSIIGNVVLYTTGGVLENIGPPACAAICLYKSRQVLIDAEDPNLLWYTKQVIEDTPVEYSDLQTIYIAPTTGAQGSTGKTKSVSAMDDKLIAFKDSAIYYVTGNGPDITGASNDFSQPTFITATVGCDNQNSIVSIPDGLMFQSGKGIWLLSRSLSTTYIGAPVEAFNNFRVLSAINVPDTNQVRFTLSNNITLMYDYYYNQWATFVGMPNISSTIYQGLHTYLNSYQQIRQETPGLYLDGSRPIEIAFTTGWFNLTGLQGLERAYGFFLLGEYLSPHKLQLDISYDYNPQPLQRTVITPDNAAPTYGADPFYGSGVPYGGPSQVEQWQIFLEKQKCQSFQLSLREIYDASYGITAGAGLTLSGIDLEFGLKKGVPKLSAARSAG